MWGIYFVFIFRFIQGECNLNAVVNFYHESYVNELLVGEIFIHLFNKQPSYKLDVSFYK